MQNKVIITVLLVGLCQIQIHPALKESEYQCMECSSTTSNVDEACENKPVKVTKPEDPMEDGSWSCETRYVTMSEAGKRYQFDRNVNNAGVPSAIYGGISVNGTSCIRWVKDGHKTKNCYCYTPKCNNLTMSDIKALPSVSDGNALESQQLLLWQSALTVLFVVLLSA